MVLKQGDKIHVVIRRYFESDLRRHFVGEVLTGGEWTVRFRGYLFLFNPSRNLWVRRPEPREAVVSLVDAGVAFTVLPPEVDLAALAYRHGSDDRLVLTDGSFTLDINEFGLNR